MNKLFQQLTKQSQLNQQSLPLRNNGLFQQFLNSSNPSDFLNSLISNNPKMQNLMQALKTSNMTPKQFFYNYAQQNGVNPDDFINSLKGENYNG
jgi:hypothetical protein